MDITLQEAQTRCTYFLKRITAQQTCSLCITYMSLQATTLTWNL